MTILKMFEQSGILTVMGLGTVFLFIIILILCMGLVHQVVHALKLDVEASQATGAATVASVPAASAPAGNGGVIAAIATAVHAKQA